MRWFPEVVKNQLTLAPISRRTMLCSVSSSRHPSSQPRPSVLPSLLGHPPIPSFCSETVSFLGLMNERVSSVILLGPSFSFLFWRSMQPSENRFSPNFVLKSTVCKMKGVGRVQGGVTSVTRFLLCFFSLFEMFLSTVTLLLVSFMDSSYFLT